MKDILIPAVFTVAGIVASNIIANVFDIDVVRVIAILSLSGVCSVTYAYFKDKYNA